MFIEIENKKISHGRECGFITRDISEYLPSIDSWILQSLSGQKKHIFLIGIYLWD